MVCFILSATPDNASKSAPVLILQAMKIGVRPRFRNRETVVCPQLLHPAFLYIIALSTIDRVSCQDKGENETTQCALGIRPPPRVLGADVAGLARARAARHCARRDGGVEGSSLPRGDRADWRQGAGGRRLGGGLRAGASQGRIRTASLRQALCHRRTAGNRQPFVPVPDLRRTRRGDA